MSPDPRDSHPEPSPVPVRERESPAPAGGPETADSASRTASGDGGRSGEGAAPGDPSGRARIAPPARGELERVRRREPAALEAFFERYFDPVYALTHRLLGERTAAEDVAQEVFLKVHRALDRLDPARDPWPWISTIAHNACRDVWRSGAYRLGRRSDSLDDPSSPGERIPAAAGGPEQQALSRERERLVREAIARLPESLREVVLLYEYEGLSHVEVADVLGLRHAAARKRYSRALEALGKMLDETLGG